MKPKLMVVRTPSLDADREYMYWIYRKYFIYGWVRLHWCTTPDEAFDYVEQNGNQEGFCTMG